MEIATHLYLTADAEAGPQKYAPRSRILLGIRRTHDEAHLSAKEAQAGSGTRVPLAHALARGQADAEAPPRQGPQATLYLKVRVGR